MTFGDRHPVSGSASCCLTCFTTEIGISAFSLTAGSFLGSCEFLFSLVITWLSLCATDFLCDICTASDGPALTIFGFCGLFLVVLCCFSAVFCLDEDYIPGWKECGRPLRL